MEDTGALLCLCPGANKGFLHPALFARANMEIIDEIIDEKFLSENRAANPPACVRNLLLNGALCLALPHSVLRLHGAAPQPSSPVMVPTPKKKPLGVDTLWSLSCRAVDILRTASATSHMRLLIARDDDAR